MLVVCILNSFTDYSFLFPAAGQGGSGLDLLHLDPRPLDFRHDALDGGRPDEGLRIFVPASQEFVPTKNSVQIEIVAFTEPQPVTFPGHADSTFLSARLFPSSCLSASRDSCSPTSASGLATLDRKSTRLNSSHLVISYAVFCLKKK